MNKTNISKDGEEKTTKEKKLSLNIDKKKNYTLKDLARHTGVSKSTVSRAFNEPNKVKESTLNLVLEAAEKLGYQPSRVARRLRGGQGQAKVIGLIIPDVMNPFFADITKGVEDVAYSNGYVLILNNSNESRDRQKICLKTLRMEGVDGIILPPVSKTELQVKNLVDEGYAVVCVDRKFRNVAVDSIVSDNRNGAYTAVNHLINLGHQRIAYIGGIPNISTSIERRRGYEDALRDHDIPINSKYIMEGDSKQGNAELLTQKILSLSNPPSALFTGNNMITLGAQTACRQLGIQIPKDLALVGYDDVPWADALNCPPTVIDQPGYEIGRRATEILMSRIKNPDRSHVTVSLDPNLIIRHSCGAQ